MECPALSGSVGFYRQARFQHLKERALRDFISVFQEEVERLGMLGEGVQLDDFAQVRFEQRGL
ncbi:MAG: hypothetical protein AAF690_15260, partial [Acidobacteriota bacterium]